MAAEVFWMRFSGSTAAVTDETTSLQKDEEVASGESIGDEEASRTGDYFEETFGVYGGLRFANHWFAP